MKTAFISMKHEGYQYVGLVRPHNIPISICWLGPTPQHPTCLKLLTAFKKWAENRGAFEIYAGISSGVELGKMDRFLRKLGFQLTGGNYSLRLGVGR